MSRRQTALVAVLIFILALLLRLPSLGGFLTADEVRIWTTLTAEFMSALLRGDWAATATSGYPGVTTTWAGSLGLSLQWLLARPADVTSLAGMAEALLADPARLDMLPWLRLGVALVSATGVVLIYLSSQRLLGTATALLAAGLISLNPFLLAHTRILNTDPLLAIFLTITWLALLLATRERQRGYWVLSGVAFGLAALSKTPALLMAPLVVLWVIWQQGHRQAGLSQLLRASLVDLLWFGVPALASALLFWPALWAAPLPTLQRIVTFSAVLSQTGHELGNYWLGQPVAGPGPLFYPAVLVWRSTPVTFLGLVLAIVAALWPTREPDPAQPAPGPASWGHHPRTIARLERPWPGNREVARALLLFVAWYVVAMSFSPKKFDRYLLPAFPALDILAAWGWLAAATWLSLRRRRRSTSRQFAGSGHAPTGTGQAPQGGWTLTAVAVVLVGLQAWSALAHLPIYLTAYNPLVGGMRTAQRVMLVGWGEGLEEVAVTLGQQPGAGDQPVAAWYGRNVFGPFYPGESYDLFYDLPAAADLYANDVEYVVTYINQLQREMLDPGVAALLDDEVASSTWRGVTLAQAYRWPKPFDHTADRELGAGLRLLGWTLGEHDAEAGSLPVSIYWDAASAAVASAPLSPVLAWIKDAMGEVWATAEGSVAVDSALLVPAWLDRQAVGQSLVLQLPAGLPAGPYQVEMAPRSGEGLGLGQVTIDPTPWQGLPIPGVEGLPQKALFADGVELVGYGLVEGDGELVLELLWGGQAELPSGSQLFVHLVGAGDVILAQHDGPLAAPRPGELARQRVRLALPEPASPDGAGESQRIYVGLYRPEDGQRLPLTVEGNAIPDGRLLLVVLSR